MLGAGRMVGGAIAAASPRRRGMAGVAANGLAAAAGPTAGATPSGVPGFLSRLAGRRQPAAQMPASPGTAMGGAVGAAVGGAQRMQGAIDPQLMANIERMQTTPAVTQTSEAQRQAMLATPSAVQQRALMARQSQPLAPATPAVDPRIAERAAYEASWANQI